MSVATRNSLIVLAAIFAALSFVAYAQAQESSVTFPVAELGGCESKQVCKAYCDEPGNFRACFAFARAHGLVPDEHKNATEEEVEKFAQVMQKGGPGGCTSPDSCRAFCEAADHMEECITFGKESGLMKGAELEEAEKVLSVLKRGGKLPGGCRGKDACETYCADPENGEECVAFALEAGFVKPEEAGVARKAMELMRSGETPGGCRGPKQCEAYCSDSSRAEECEAFAKKLGIEPPRGGDAQQMRVQGPGGCSTPEECSAFCEENRDACRGFGGYDREGRAIRIEEERSGPESHFPDFIMSCLGEKVARAEVEKVLRNERPRAETEAALMQCLETMRPSDGPQGSEGRPPQSSPRDEGGEGRWEGRPEGFESRPVEGFEAPRGENVPFEMAPEGFLRPQIPPGEETRSFETPAQESAPLLEVAPQSEPAPQIDAAPEAAPPPSPDAPQSLLRGARTLLGAVISAFQPR